MSFLSNFGVTGILYSFRLVQEGEEGKEIPELLRLEFLETFSLNNSAFFKQRRYSRCFVLDFVDTASTVRNFLRGAKLLS